ncbi:unnamed protein product [Cylicostephanus goldi]|uniref:Uncharacterized protein n=1 Tax=Cylicostephanus goldi TaxID=71465 RepID=A0A3P7MIZ7_CYLGO|nr:unnamed protein product [Cylicostephanus goldi]
MNKFCANVQWFLLACVDSYCPPGKFCQERVFPCKNPPCRPILFCLPNEENGCARHKCPANEVCVERVEPCINKICKKIPSCAKPGTCDALVCPPSQHCVANPKPRCETVRPVRAPKRLDSSAMRN